MARPDDSTFGAGFNADAFRNAITSTMQMGMPGGAAEMATFQWRTGKTYGVEADSSGVPFDFTASPTSTSPHADVIVPVALEFSGNVSGVTELTPDGSFENPYAVLTLLDIHHSQIVGANTVLLGGNTYVIRYTEPPIGLFEVTVYRIHLQAIDES